MPAVIRMRKILSPSLPQPAWPPGTNASVGAQHDPIALHTILASAYQNGFGSVPSLKYWWQALTTDSEFDPALLIVATTRSGQPIGLVQCWTSAFIKDLAVAQDWRGRGIGAALLLTAFKALQERGAVHADLKVMRGNSNAIRLYLRLGMVEVPEA